MVEANNKPIPRVKLLLNYKKLTENKRSYDYNKANTLNVDKRSQIGYGVYILNIYSKYRFYIVGKYQRVCQYLMFDCDFMCILVLTMYKHYNNYTGSLPEFGSMLGQADKALLAVWGSAVVCLLRLHQQKRAISRKLDGWHALLAS